MKEITFELLKLTIMIMSMLITRFVIPWLRQKMQNEVTQSMLDWTMQAVLAAEQVYSAETGADRKAIVTAFLKKILIEKNISISDGEIDVLIESAVKQMNMGAI